MPRSDEREKYICFKIILTSKTVKFVFYNWSDYKILNPKKLGFLLLGYCFKPFIKPNVLLKNNIYGKQLL